MRRSHLQTLAASPMALPWAARRWRTNYGGELVLWTRRSMQQLVKLAVAFYVQHGRELALHLFEEEDIDA